jgi:hypothetical protein
MVGNLGVLGRLTNVREESTLIRILVVESFPCMWLDIFTNTYFDMLVAFQRGNG